jgi:aspartate dehydrogenase
MRSIGVVGCGSIGRAILTAADDGRLPLRIAGVTSRTEASARHFLSALRSQPPYLTRQALIADADLIVETAGGGVVADLATDCFAAGKDLMVISVGALLQHPELAALARERGCRLLVPSGAIAGLDGVKAACEGDVALVRLTSRKPPRALEGAPFLTERGISLAGLQEERELFSGSARDACLGFPDNVNVAAALSLAGIGPDRTQVRIIAVPGLDRNCHEIEVEGDFGRLSVRIENVPSENPKTGRLTTLAVIRAIRDAADGVRIGT